MLCYYDFEGSTTSLRLSASFASRSLFLCSSCSCIFYCSISCYLIFSCSCSMRASVRLIMVSMRAKPRKHLLASFSTVRRSERLFPDLMKVAAGLAGLVEMLVPPGPTPCSFFTSSMPYQMLPKWLRVFALMSRERILI